MKDKNKPMKNLKDVDKCIAELKKDFFLQGWEIDMNRYDSKEKVDDTGEVAADCTPRERYRSITLRFYPAFFTKDKSYDDQYHIIIHELCHTITGIQNGLIQSLKEDRVVTGAEIAEAYERETSWIANIIYRLLRKF